MVRILGIIAGIVLITACSAGDDPAESDDVAADAPTSEAPLDEASSDEQADDSSDDDAGGEFAIETVPAYTEVLIAEGISSSLGDTEVDATDAIESLEFAGTLPEGTVPVAVPLYVRNQTREDVAPLEVVAISYVTDAGEYGADAACGSLIGALEDTSVIEWAEAETMWVCRAVPAAEAVGGAWHVTSPLSDGGYIVVVP